MKFELVVLVIIGGLLFAGCCGSTYKASNTGEGGTDPYQKYYGTEKKVSSSLALKFDGYKESLDSDGTKTVMLTLTVTNSGTEKEDVGSALFVSDEADRNFEANPFLCSALVNPGLSKQFDCSFFEVPPKSRIVAIKMGDSVMEKGKYTTLFAFE